MLTRADNRRSQLLDGIIAYERSELAETQAVALFQELHDTGLAYELNRPAYRNTCMSMPGVITSNPPQGMSDAPYTFTRYERRDR